MNVLSIDIGGTGFRIGAVRADGSLIGMLLVQFKKHSR